MGSVVARSSGNQRRIRGAEDQQQINSQAETARGDYEKKMLEFQQRV